MLQIVKIKNFQNHKSTEISLDGGVNIISGSSDCGKTAIFRAINWVLSNRPSGFGFKPWDSSKKDTTEVSLQFDGGTVTRIKGNTVDKYILAKDGGETQEYSSLNRQVPAEVLDFINLQEYNLGSQHDSPFFVAESPSQAASMLNEISGLSIIDSSLANINSKIRENTAKQKQLEGDIESLLSKIQKIEFIDEADKLLVHLESLSAENERLDSLNTALETYVFEDEQLDRKIEELTPILNCKDKVHSLRLAIKEYKDITDTLIYSCKAFNELNRLDSIIVPNTKIVSGKEKVIWLKKQIKEYYELKNSYDALSTYIDSLTNVEGVIESTKEWLLCKPKCDKLTQLISKVSYIENDIEDLENWVKNVRINDNEIINLTTLVKSCKQKKVDFMVRDGKCILCGSDIG